MKEFLCSVKVDMEEAELVGCDLQDDPLVQHCEELEKKLSSLLINFKVTASPSPGMEQQEITPTKDRVFVERERLMTRAHSLKKAVGKVVDASRNGTAVGGIW